MSGNCASNIAQPGARDVDDDEANQTIQLQFDGTDPYFDLLEDFEIELEDLGIEGWGYEELGTIVQYRVDITYHPSYRNWVSESYIVEVDKQNQKVSCECKGFEVEGLLCCHVIKVMLHINMPHLPAHYILTRWTKNANINTKRTREDRSMDVEENAELQSLRFASIKSALMEMGKMGVVNVEAFNCLKQIVTNGTEMLQSLVGDTMSKSDTPRMQAELENHSKGPTENPSFLDPPESQCKGTRRKPTRFKSASEGQAKKMRKCSICNAKEGHNLRTCPKRKLKVGKGKEKANEESSEEEEEIDEADSA